MRGRAFLWVLIGLAALGVGCGDDDMVGVDGGPPGDGGRTDGGRTDGGRTDGGGGGDDGNDSFAEAETLTVDAMTPTSAALQAPGDFDYFTFTVDGETWISIATEANPDDDPEMVDTVITLYDSMMTQVAENDDGVPRASTDSEIIYHVPAAGTYYVEVQEWTTWTSDPMLEGMASYTYDISVIELDPAAPAVVIDEEPGNDAASAVPLEFTTTAPNVSFAGGTFSDDTDIDVYSFTVAANQFLNVIMMPPGVDGYGSTAAIGDIYITNAAGDEIIGRLNNGAGDYEDFGPALAAGNYLLWIEHAGTTAGTNDFWFLKSIKSTENPAEAEETANDVAATAEALTQEADMMTGIRSAFILAQLPNNTDVDHFSFTVMADEQVSVACGAETSGSGVRGLNMQVQDSTGATTLSMDMESAPDGAFLEDAMITAPGTYLLRLSKTGQDPDVTSTFVRCGVRAGVPMMM
jgi:hypothetical protein